MDLSAIDLWQVSFIICLLEGNCEFQSNRESLNANSSTWPPLYLWTDFLFLLDFHHNM